MAPIGLQLAAIDPAGGCTVEFENQNPVTQRGDYWIPGSPPLRCGAPE
jgi:hypothetical protein